MRKFLSGNEAFAEGVRLARPQVISAYPITPQTTVVEALASMVEEGSLSAEYLHVESEHTALAAAIGAAATGARARSRPPHPRGCSTWPSASPTPRAAGFPL